MIVAFSGVDCSGKTTQLELLARHLEASDVAVRTLWYRPGYSRTLDRARALARAVLRRDPPSSRSAADLERRERAFGRPGVSIAWILIASIDTAVQYAAKLRWWRLSGFTVLVDRYLDDAALDLRLRFPDHGVATTAAIGALEASCPRPDVHLLLVLGRDRMLERAARKDEPFPDHPAVGEARLQAYRELAESGRVVVIDADGSIDEVHERVVAAVTLGGRVAPIR